MSNLITVMALSAAVLAMLALILIASAMLRLARHYGAPDSRSMQME